MYEALLSVWHVVWLLFVGNPEVGDGGGVAFPQTAYLETASYLLKPGLFLTITNDTSAVLSSPFPITI
jgi:hypothetical protein